MTYDAGRQRRYYAAHPGQALVNARKYRATTKVRSDGIKSDRGYRCADCGVVYPPHVLDWDHRPGESKIANVGSMKRFSEERLRAEVAKCDLVCANCHRARTHERGYRG